tara:strand:+ start:312 stop:1112 length:801 start_codon:yes stop_codon:yes gene_type:complete
MIKAIISGAAGRMGRSLIGAVQTSDEFSLVGALESENSELLGLDAGELAGVGKAGVLLSTTDESLVEQADVMIDFSSPLASVFNAETCAELGTALVIGTTGMDVEQEKTLKKGSNRIPIFVSPNMSLGMSMLYRLVENAVSTLGKNFDVEIFEAHHSGKKDAPSGTALRLGEVIANARGVDLREKAVFDRSGDIKTRVPDSIGFSSVRGGDIAGDHTVILAGDGERLELTHRAHDRSNFVHGALLAASFVCANPPGLYGMSDLLGE